MRFRRAFTVLPGVKVNITPNGLSTTIGKGPLSINTGSHGTFANVHVPGTPFWDRIKLTLNSGETLEDKLTSIGKECSGWFSRDTTTFLRRGHRLFSDVQKEWGAIEFPPPPFVISPAELDTFVDYGMSIAKCVRWYILNSGDGTTQAFKDVVESDYSVLTSQLAEVRSGDVAAIKQFHENIATFIRVQLRLFVE